MNNHPARKTNLQGNLDWATHEGSNELPITQTVSKVLTDEGPSIAFNATRFDREFLWKIEAISCASQTNNESSNLLETREILLLAIHIEKYPHHSS